MKKTIFASYLAGLERHTPGESYTSIVRYFIPECITAFLTYSFTTLFDAQCISQLHSPCMYATMSITKTIVHFLTKIAEGVSVGTMVVCGIAHGRNSGKEVSISAGSALSVACILGGSISLFLGLFPFTVYRYILGTSQEIALVGAPYLQLRAISIFLMFIFCTITGFLRGIKKNTIAAQAHVLGTAVFIISDYFLILGKCGLPRLCLKGSAISSILQYSIMITYTAFHLMRDPIIQSYIASISIKSWTTMCRIVTVSWPVMCDKGALAVAKLVLGKAITPMGQLAIGSFGLIQDIETFIFVPAIAFAQVVTFLVSNEIGNNNIEGVKYTIKKVLFLASSSVALIICICVKYSDSIMNWLDSTHHFSSLSIPAFRVISLLVLCDVVQVVLAGALRGLTQVRIVLQIRTLTLIFFFMPVAYIASNIVFCSDFVKFITIYSSFYIGNGIMAVWYIYLLRTDRWKQLPW